VRNCKRAFTVIELLIVVFIVGLGASMVVPRLLRRSPSTEWTTIRGELNNMLYFARQEAITSQKVHRLVFNQKQRLVTVEVDSGEEKPGVHTYEVASSYYFTTNYTLPEEVSFTTIKLGKIDLFEENKGVAYCYVVPHGLVQDIQVTLRRKAQDGESVCVFHVSPFLGKFEIGKVSSL